MQQAPTDRRLLSASQPGRNTPLYSQLFVIPVKQLCGLEASQGTVAEVLSSAASARADDVDSNDELDPEDEEGDNDRKEARKKKNKRRKGAFKKSIAKHVQHLTREIIPRCSLK